VAETVGIGLLCDSRFCGDLAGFLFRFRPWLFSCEPNSARWWARAWQANKGSEQDTIGRSESNHSKRRWILSLTNSRAPE